MSKIRKIIIGVIGVGVVLAIAALSRPASLYSFPKSDSGQAKPLFGMAQGWINDTVLAPASGGVAKIQQPVQQEIVKQKDNLLQNLWQESMAFMATKFSQLSGTPLSGANCSQP